MTIQMTTFECGRCGKERTIPTFQYKARAQRSRDGKLFCSKECSLANTKARSPKSWFPSQRKRDAGNTGTSSEEGSVWPD